MFEEILRPFWADGLNAVSGRQSISFIDVVQDKNVFIIHDQIGKTSFNLEVTDYEAFLKGLAFDINRFGCASIESINDVHYKTIFPKSHAWKCVKSYYAAYYAAHATLRMMGISCTNFETNDLKLIETIADLYNTKGGISIDKGYYKCSIENINSKKKIVCKKIVESGKKGSHEQLWGVYLKALDDMLIEISNKGTSLEIQKILSKLSDLKNNLTDSGAAIGGNWLSQVRNEINYKHKNGLWYPYKSSEKHYDQIEKTIEFWKKDPEKIELSIYPDKPILKFLSTCVFVISIYSSMVKGMSKRHPKDKSFHKDGVLSFINKMS